MAGWEQIGDWTPIGSNINDVPRWVMKSIKRLDLGGYDSRGGRCVLKGKHFEYIIAHSQHGTYCTIYRRQRH